MNWLLVVKQTLRESVRGHELTVLLALFGIVFGAVGLVVGAVGSDPSTADLLQLLLVASVLVVPLAGLLLGYPTVAKKREDGRLRLVLGQPVSRPAIVLGSYVAKVLVVGVAVLVGVLAALGGFAASSGPAVPDEVVAFVLATIALGAAYLAISVGASAASSTSKWATLNLLGVYLLLVGLWRIVPYFLLFVAEGFAFPDSVPAWVDLVAGLSPSVAFERLFGFHGIEFFVAEHYTSTAFSVAVLLGWIVLLPAAGLWRFVRTDL